MEALKILYKYSKEKNVSVKLKLNKVFDVNLIKTVDDTDESLIQKARQFVFREYVRNSVSDMNDTSLIDDLIVSEIQKWNQ